MNYIEIRESYRNILKNIRNRNNIQGIETNRTIWGNIETILKTKETNENTKRIIMHHIENRVYSNCGPRNVARASNKKNNINTQ